MTLPFTEAKGSGETAAKQRTSSTSTGFSWCDMMFHSSCFTCRSSFAGTEPPSIVCVFVFVSFLFFVFLGSLSLFRRSQIHTHARARVCSARTGPTGPCVCLYVRVGERDARRTRLRHATGPTLCYVSVSCG